MNYSLPKSEKLPLLRHSIAHIMAEAVMNLFRRLSGEYF